MNPNETPEDIIAEYRADVALMFAKDIPPPTPDYVAIILNRIEDAVGRRTVAEARIRHRHGNAAAPARNCDRFDNYSDARSEYDGNVGAPEWQFGSWLFAPAKGGAK